MCLECQNVECAHVFLCSSFPCVHDITTKLLANMSSLAFYQGLSYFSKRSSVGDLPSLRHLRAFAGLMSSVHSRFELLPCILAVRDANWIRRRMWSGAVSASESGIFSSDSTKNTGGFSALPTSRTCRRSSCREDPTHLP